MTNKYGARRGECRYGHQHDSQGEIKRCWELAQMVNKGMITDLAVHPRWELVVNNHKIGRYTGDFSYIEKGVFVVEDVKPFNRKTGKVVASRDYILRKKLMFACHGIEIKETPA